MEVGLLFFNEKWMGPFCGGGLKPRLTCTRPWARLPTWSDLAVLYYCYYCNMVEFGRTRENAETRGV